MPGAKSLLAVVAELVILTGLGHGALVESQHTGAVVLVQDILVANKLGPVPRAAELAQEQQVTAAAAKRAVLVW